jgi:hypothetical protein
VRKRRASTPRAAAADRRSVRLPALAVFAGALLSRVLFWLATPDRAWGWTAWFKGDAPVWMEWARAIGIGAPFELGLPIHPPGAAYLVSLLWDGGGTGFLRFAWIAIGALLPVLVFLAAERSLGLRVAAVAGCWTALSAGMIALSTSINNETPYLALAIGAILPMEGLRERPRTGRLALWSAWNGVACLFRVEHALFFVLALVWLAAGWARRSGARALRPGAAALLFFALPLVPWHLSAWSAIRRFNEEPRQLTPTEERAVSAVERELEAIPWTADALRERDRLPGFSRRTASAFVLATVAHRGGREVGGEDFGILDQAFGYRPRPVAGFPFVSSYGPLNFALANNARATGGFDRSPLEEPPPLAGGPSSYPEFLVRGLPPADLAFVYPPHLRLFNEGYSVGWKWIRENPGQFARLAAKKLAIFWSGASAGLTGWNLPMGLSGRRPPVDMVSPDGDGAAIAWRIAVLLACVGGIASGVRRRAAVPWLLFLATKVAVAVAFFGYARQGAVVVPVVAVLAAIAVERWIPARPSRWIAAALLAGVLLEGARFASKPDVRIDGTVVGREDPFPPDEHEPHRVEVTRGQR